MFFNRYTIIAATAVLMVSLHASATKKEKFIKKLEIAHKQGDVEKLFKKTEKMNLLDEGDLNHIFINAAQNGHYRVIQKFFKPENQTFLNQISRATLMLAAHTMFTGITHGTKKRVRHSFYILQEFIKPTNDSFLKNIKQVLFSAAFYDSIFSLAIDKNNFDIIDEFFNNQNCLNKISPKNLAKCLETAAKNGNIKLVTKFLANKSVTSQLKKEDFKMAAMCAKTNGIKKLIKQYAPKKKFIFWKY